MFAVNVNNRKSLKKLNHEKIYSKYDFNWVYLLQSYLFNYIFEKHLIKYLKKYVGVIFANMAKVFNSVEIGYRFCFEQK